MAIKDPRFDLKKVEDERKANPLPNYSITTQSIANNSITPDKLIDSWPVFKGDFAGITTNTSNYNPFLNSSINIGFTLTASSSRLTIQTSGFYHIHAQQLVSTSGGAYLHIRKNGTTVAYAYSDNDTTYDLVVSTVIQCGTGEYIDFYYQNTITYSWPTPHSSVTCFLIR